MASEYLRKKYQDVKPSPPVVLTTSEKRKNWWHYHKWHIGIALVLLLILGNIVWHFFHQAEADYRVAYVGIDPLPSDTAAALETAFASLGQDLNGDGKVAVILTQYLSGSEDTGVAAAAEVSLMADLLECESYFFLLEDPEQFQRKYHTLCCLDGSLPDEEDNSVEGIYLQWDECPALARLDLGSYAYSLMGGTVTGSGNDLVSGLYFARRGFWTEETVPYLDGCEALWNKLTEVP